MTNSQIRMHSPCLCWDAIFIFEALDDRALANHVLGEELDQIDLNIGFFISKFEMGNMRPGPYPLYSVVFAIYAYISSMPLLVQSFPDREVKFNENRHTSNEPRTMI